MDALGNLLHSPWIAILLLAVLALEACFFLYLWMKKQRGLPPLQVLSFLGAGAGFALALGSVMAGLSPVFTGLALGTAFVFHVADIKLRWHS